MKRAGLQSCEQSLLQQPSSLGRWTARLSVHRQTKDCCSTISKQEPLRETNWLACSFKPRSAICKVPAKSSNRGVAQAKFPRADVDQKHPQGRSESAWGFLGGVQGMFRVWTLLTWHQDRSGHCCRCEPAQQEAIKSHLHSVFEPYEGKGDLAW